MQKIINSSIITPMTVGPSLCVILKVLPSFSMANIGHCVIDKGGYTRNCILLKQEAGSYRGEDIIYDTPKNVRQRKPMEFTCNEVLKQTGKNVLLVCWNNNIYKERIICEMLYLKCNLYIKPHPGDKDNPAYPNGRAISVCHCPKDWLP